MIHIIITSYKEPNATVKAIKAFLNQKIKEKFRIIVVDPFSEAEEFIMKNIKDKRVEFFLDPGEGKNYALNLVFEKIYSENKDDLIIFSDGDVYIGENALEEIIIKFKDKKVGSVTGMPASIDSRDTMLGYWSKILYAGIHKVRIKANRENKFFQCSGYLFAIRNGLIKEIPLDVPEDAIIPYFIWKKSYKIEYADKAIVYVKYPSNWKDWVSQRIRTIKAHENISKLYSDMPRTKSFFNEIKAGLFYAIRQPRNPRELLWTIILYWARLYIYSKSYKEMQRKRYFDPAWREEEIKSTKML
ncbi:MAG: glycosyltransferase family 2 protein, partial [Nanoarchaeota archaeon]